MISERVKKTLDWAEQPRTILEIAELLKIEHAASVTLRAGEQEDSFIVVFASDGETVYPFSPCTHIGGDGQWVFMDVYYDVTEMNKQNIAKGFEDVFSYAEAVVN